MDAYTEGKFAGWFEALAWIESYVQNVPEVDRVEMFHLVKQMRTEGPASAGNFSGETSAKWEEYGN